MSQDNKQEISQHNHEHGENCEHNHEPHSHQHDDSGQCEHDHDNDPNHQHSHDHSENHSHCGGGHGHSHVPKDKKILAISFAVITLFMIVEFWGGWYFKSLTLMADAGHMANDSFSLFLALIALFLGASKQRWFAMLNGASLVFVAVMILWEAIERMQNPTAEMMALPMLAVATLGLLVNIGVAWLMLKSDHSNLNIKAAYLHVLADMLGSVVAIVAGLSAWLFGWFWVDTVASAILSVFILRSGLSVVRAAWLQKVDFANGAHNHSH